MFIHLVPTSPSFIQIQFKTLRSVGVISAFYKAFVRFSSRSIEAYSAEENRCCIFFFLHVAFDKFVNSFITV